MNKSDGVISVGERVLTGTLWVGLWRWTARLIGLVTTIILARVLTPGDFGIVATAGVVIAFFGVLIDLGTDSYLIRLPDPTGEDYDTAWTLRLGLIVLASIFIFLAATPMAGFFEDNRLINVIRVLAIVSLMRGFSNIGLTMYRRDLQYDKIAFVGLGQRVIGSIATVGLVFIFPSYWAMVLGSAVMCIAELALSYAIHPYRPRPTLVRFSEQWEFSKWIVVRNVAAFLQGQGASFVVAKMFGIEQIGLLSMATKFAELPTRQLTSPMGNPIYSGLAKKQEDPVQFKHNILQIIGATSAVMFPLAILFGTLGEAIVLAILGPRWLPAAPLILPLVLSGVFSVLAQTAGTALTVAGHIRVLAIINWIGAIAVVSVMLMAGYFGNLQQLVFARAGVSLALLGLCYALIVVILAVPWTRLIASIYRPGIGCLVMGAVTTSIAATAYGPWVKIILASLVGGLTYVMLVYGLWRSASSPDSGEALLVRQISKLLGRVLGRLGR